MREEAARQNEIVTIRLTEDVNWDAIDRTRNVPHMEVGYSTIIGTRSYQQDALFVKQYDGDVTLAVVCDGMGGLNGGEVASNTAVKTLVEDFDQVGDFSNVPQFLEKEAVKLDGCVADLEDEYGNSLGGGCTIVCVVTKGNQMYFLSVGDSRIYVVRDGNIQAINRDHNFRLQLDTMLREGQITEEEYRQQEDQAEALISFLGIGNVSLIDHNTEPLMLCENDLIILCSDGLYKRLSNEAILDIVDDNQNSMQSVAERLNQVVMQLTQRNQDNTSIILLKYGR